MGKLKLNIDRFFNPQSIAVVGVSSKGFTFGGSSYFSRLLTCGYKGRLYPINPKIREIMGVEVFPSLDDLPEIPDLAIVSIAAKHIPSLLELCGRIGLRHIHILSSGFSEIGTQEGKALEAEVLKISQQNNLLIIGPNCMGPYCPSSGLTLYGASPGITGSLGIISQSGGITQRFTEYACSLNVGVGKAISFGNGVVLDGCDYLQYFADDEKIKVIAMYLESVRDGRRFLRLAKEVNRKKPIVLLLGGRSKVGAKTVMSHTGSMAGSYSVWEGFSRQTGITLVKTIEEWMDAILALSLLPAPKGNGVFIGCGFGGKTVISGDTAVEEGLDVPVLSETSIKALSQKIVNVGSIVGNPLDSMGMSLEASHFSEVLEVIYEEPTISMVLVEQVIPRKIFHFPDKMPDATPGVIDFLRDRQGRKPTVVSLDYDGGDLDLGMKGIEMRTQFCRAGIPSYPSARRAAKALKHLYTYHLGKWRLDRTG